MSFDVLFFEVRGRRCALPVSVVREVLATPPVTPVPLAPPLLRGLVPVRGQVIPLLDVGTQLGLGGSDGADAARFLPTEQDRIVVVEAGAVRPPGRAYPLATPGGLRRQPHQPPREHPRRTSRRPPPRPRFVSATLFDVEGPALLLDAALAVESLRESLSRQGAP